MSPLILSLLVACSQADPGSKAAPEPTVVPAPAAPEPEAPMPDAKEVATAWATAKDPDARVSKLGSATGLPAFTVRTGAAGEAPTKEYVVAIDGEEVLVGRSGWRVFLERYGHADAPKTAAAWLALYKGEAQEPFGKTRTYKKKPVPEPKWSGDVLVVIYAGHRGPHRAKLRLGPEDTVEVVDDSPWSPSPF